MQAKPICPDASFVMRLLLATDEDHPAVQRWREWEKQGLVPTAPALLGYEVTNALHRYERMGELLPDEVDDALALSHDLAIRLVEDPNLHQRALRIARELALPAAYDAHYIALAERLGCEFWTFDARLVRAASAKLPWVRFCG